MFVLESMSDLILDTFIAKKLENSWINVRAKFLGR